MFVSMKVYLNTLVITGYHRFLSYSNQKFNFSILIFFDILRSRRWRCRSRTGGFLKNRGRLPEVVTSALVVGIMQNHRQMKI